MLSPIERLPYEERPRLAELRARGRVHEAAGEIDAAVAVYRELVEPATSAPWASFIDTLHFYDLARLEDRAGDHAAAREHYARFLELWGDTDIPLPDAERARERLGEL